MLREPEELVQGLLALLNATPPGEAPSQTMADGPRFWSGPKRLRPRHAAARNAAEAFCAAMSFKGRPVRPYLPRPDFEPTTRAIGDAIYNLGGPAFWELLNDLKLALRPIAESRTKKKVNPTALDEADECCEAAFSRYDAERRTHRPPLGKIVAARLSQTYTELERWIEHAVEATLRGRPERKRLPFAPRLRICDECGRIFMKDMRGTGGKRDFCSPKHRTDWWNRQVSKKRASARRRR